MHFVLQILNSADYKVYKVEKLKNLKKNILHQL